MKTLADEIIEGSLQSKENVVAGLLNKPVNKFISKRCVVKPKSAGNKSFRIHNSLRFMKSVERSRLGKENKLSILK